MRELMENKQGRDDNPKTTRLQKFATFVMGGFKNSPHILAVGSYGEELTAIVKRCINARGAALVADGIRSPITYRLMKEAAEMDFWTEHSWGEVDGSATLTDFPYRSKGKLERYRLGTEKGDVPRGALPNAISDFADAANQETKFIELLYGEEHGAGRYEEIPFSEQLRRGNPELYTVAFVVGTWHRAHVDFFEGMHGCIRRLLPMTTDAADR